MDSSTANFDGDLGIESRDGSLEGGEGSCLVGKDTKLTVMGPETHARRDLVFVWPEPGVALGLLENVVEGGVVTVVVHWGKKTRRRR